MKHILIGLVVAAVCVGCVVAPPAISDIDSDSVEIVVDNMAGDQESEIKELANKACGMYNRVPVRLSSRATNCTPGLFGPTCTHKAILFACRLPADMLREVE